MIILTSSRIDPRPTAHVIIIMCQQTTHLFVAATASILSAIVTTGVLLNIRRLSSKPTIKAIQPNITVVQVLCLTFAALSGILLCLDNTCTNPTNSNTNTTSSLHSPPTSHSHFGGAYAVAITYCYATFLGLQLIKQLSILQILKAGVKRKKSPPPLMLSLVKGMLVGLIPALINMVLYLLDVPMFFLFAIGATSLVVLAVLGQVTRSQLLPLLQVHSLLRLDEGDDVYRGLVVCASVALTAVAFSDTGTGTGTGTSTSTSTSTALGFSVASAITSVSMCHMQYWHRIRLAWYPPEDWSDIPSEATVANSFSTDINTTTALTQAVKDLQLKLGGENKISFLVVQLTSTHDGALVEKILDDLLPGVPYVGSTSCRGVMSERGWQSNVEHTFSLGLLGIKDDEGYYAVASSSIGADENPFELAVQATQRLLERGTLAAASKASKGQGAPPSLFTPSFVWCSIGPGNEEMVLEGIRSVVGSCPIIGGSSADNKVNGNWYQLCSEDQRYTKLNGFSIGIAYSSMVCEQCFFSCYTPTSFRGIVTKGDGRHIYEINGERAVDVYNRWTGGEVQKHLDELNGSSDHLNVLGLTTLFPLGKKIGLGNQGESLFQIIHPSNVNNNGSFDTFANVNQGDEIFCMAGTKENLKSSISKCSQQLLRDSSVALNEVIGALVVFCGGCMLQIEEEMDIPCKKLSSQLGGSPFLGCHTFGEVGRFADGQVAHGNLMFSVLLFTSRRKKRKIVSSRTGQVRMLGENIQHVVARKGRRMSRG